MIDDVGDASAGATGVFAKVCALVGRGNPSTNTIPANIIFVSHFPPQNGIQSLYTFFSRLAFSHRIIQPTQARALAEAAAPKVASASHRANFGAIKAELHRDAIAGLVPPVHVPAAKL